MTCEIDYKVLEQMCRAAAGHLLSAEQHEAKAQEVLLRLKCGGSTSTRRKIERTAEMHLSIALGYKEAARALTQGVAIAATPDIADVLMGEAIEQQL